MSSKTLARQSLALVLAALLGFLDSLYLTVEHFSGRIPTCTIAGCERVLTSSYATVGSVPVALFGALYYLFCFIAAVLYFETRSRIFLRALFIASSVGLLVTLWFVYLQLFVIGAICQYCMLSALATASIFGLSLYIINNNKK